MAVKLNDLIFKKGTKELTTGAKIGAGVLAGGAAILMSKLKAKKQQQKEQAQTQVAITERTTLTDVPVEATQKPKSNTMLYVGLGVGAVLIIGAVLFISKKKA